MLDGLTSQTGGATKGAPAQACVLLVEDDRSLRRYLEVTLQRAGYRVMAAADGIEAVQIAHSSSIDIVVTDAIMPQLNGQQLASLLRGNARFAQVPIVLLTGQENKGAVSATASIDAFLYKPIRADELKNCLAKLLNKS
jgi:two-component system, chemotaxis family, sensor histidine kinase and response regulator PixL